MTAALRAALEALPRAHRVGDEWTACCPNHDDRSPSLGWRYTHERILLNCRAGCPKQSIVDTMGFTLADLFDGRPTDSHHFVRPAKPTNGSKHRERRWTAYDTDTRPWVHVRVDDPTGGKKIRWATSGVRLENLRLYGYGADALPYGPEPVYIGEGEPAADALRATGRVALATYGTAHRPTAEALAELTDREVILWPDADSDPAKGKAHMLAIAASLKGIVAKQRWIEPPADAFEGWDAADATPDQIEALVRTAGPVPTDPAEPQNGDHQQRPAVDLAHYLSAVEGFLCRYVAFPSEHEPVAVALWIAQAHLVERFDVSPILTVTSAEMRSGKTRVLDCLELLVPEPFRVILPSEAVVYTVLSQRPRPTLLLDEAETIFGTRTAEKYEGLRAILNAGNRKGTPVRRVRMDGHRREVERFDVFGPKAVAGIGKLPDTVADRAIPIRMRRRAATEPIERFRQRIATAQASGIVADWSAVTLVTDVTVPEGLNDRAADGWEPLLAIADAAGGQWPQRARLAAVALTSGDDDQVSVGIRLLGDIREAFGDGSYLQTAELLRRLHDLEDAPWAEWYGKPLTARGLAKLLEPYRVSPTIKRVAGDVSRGYFRSGFDDAFGRYLPKVGNGFQGDVEVSPVFNEEDQGTASWPPAEPVTTVTTVTTATEVVADQGETIACSDYSAHQTKHRRTDTGWTCDVCTGAVSR